MIGPSAAPAFDVVSKRPKKRRERRAPVLSSSSSTTSAIIVRVSSSTPPPLLRPATNMNGAASHRLPAGKTKRIAVVTAACVHECAGERAVLAPTARREPPDRHAGKRGDKIERKPSACAVLVKPSTNWKYQRKSPPEMPCEMPSRKSGTARVSLQRPAHQALDPFARASNVAVAAAFLPARNTIRDGGHHRQQETMVQPMAMTAAPFAPSRSSPNESAAMPAITSISTWPMALANCTAPRTRARP